MHDIAFKMDLSSLRSMTDEMIRKLRGDSFPTDKNEFLNESIESFFDKCFAEKNLRKSDIIREANIAQAYGYQIFKGEKIAARDYYIGIALAMHLDFPTTQRLLALTGTGPLHPLILRDACIIYSIVHGYNMEQTYEMFMTAGVDPIRTDSKKKPKYQDGNDDE